jgi:hypothetical protein
MFMFPAQALTFVAHIGASHRWFGGAEKGHRFGLP